jgi:hypothetical protein
MTKFTSSAIAISVGLAFSIGAIAQTMSPEQYRSGKDRIAVESKAASTACDSLAGNAKDICKTEAGGKDKVARAELDAKYQPSLDASYKLRLARAEAELSVATERCDDKAGNVKDVCVKEAKAAEASAKADAKAKLTTANANEQAARTSTAANDKAGEKGAAARNNAASTKRDAEYTVAKEKCDAFAGDAKSNCMNEAKARFDRS